MDFIRFFEKRIDKYKAVCYTGTCIFTGKGGNPMGIFSKLFGSYSTRELARIEPIKQKVLALDEEYTALSDAELKGKTQEFRDRLESGETLDSMMAEALATVREAAYRVLGKKPFPVQIIGAIVLHQGRIAEMKTGELSY